MDFNIQKNNDQTIIYGDYLIAFVSDFIDDPNKNYAGKYGGVSYQSSFNYTQLVTNKDGVQQEEDRSFGFETVTSDNDFGQYKYQNLTKEIVGTIGGYSLYKIRLTDGYIKLQMNNSNVFTGNGTKVFLTNHEPKSQQQLNGQEFNPNNTTHYNETGTQQRGGGYRQFVIIQFGYDSYTDAIQGFSQKHNNETDYIRPPLLTATDNANKILQDYYKYGQLTGLYDQLTNGVYTKFQATFYRYFQEENYDCGWGCGFMIPKQTPIMQKGFFFRKGGYVADLGYLYNQSNAGIFLYQDGQFKEIYYEAPQPYEESKHFFQDNEIIRQDTLDEYADGVRISRLTIQFYTRTTKGSTLNVSLKIQKQNGDDEIFVSNLSPEIQQNYTHTYYRFFYCCEVPISFDDSKLYAFITSNIKQFCDIKTIPYLEQTQVVYGGCSKKNVNSSPHDFHSHNSYNAIKHVLLSNCYDDNVSYNDDIFKDVRVYHCINSDKEKPCSYCTWNIDDLKELYLNGVYGYINMIAQYMRVIDCHNLYLYPKKEACCYLSNLNYLETIPQYRYWVNIQKEDGTFERKQQVIQYKCGIELYCNNVQNIMLNGANIVNLTNSLRSFTNGYHSMIIPLSIIGCTDVTITDSEINELVVFHGNGKSIKLYNSEFDDVLLYQANINEQFVVKNNNVGIINNVGSFIIKDGYFYNTVFDNNYFLEVLVENTVFVNSLVFTQLVANVCLENVTIQDKTLRCEGCKNFDYDVENSFKFICSDLKQVDQNNTTWLLNQYRYDIGNQRCKLSKPANLILQNVVLDNVFIVNSSYNKVELVSEQIVIKNSYLRDVDVQYDNFLKAEKFYSQICLLNQNRKNLSQLIVFQLPLTELTITDSKINRLYCNDYNVFITKTNIGYIQAIQFSKLFLLFDFIFTSSFKSLHERRKDIYIKSCELGKTYIQTRGKILNSNRYQNYVIKCYNELLDSSILEYVQENNITLDQFWADFEKHAFVYDIKKPQFKLNQIPSIYFDQFKQFIFFSIVNCTFCCIDLDLQSYTPIIFNNVSTSDCKYKPLNFNNEQQWVYNKEEAKYYRSIILNNIQAQQFFFSNNQLQRLYINNCPDLKCLYLDSNKSILKYVQLTNNQQLQAIKLKNNNVIETLKVKNCILKQLNVTKQTFPKIKHLQLTDNDKIYDWSTAVYKNEIVLNQFRIKQDDMPRQQFYNLTQGLQYKYLLDTDNGFICSVLFNDNKVFIKQQIYEEILNLFKQKYYIDTLYKVQIKIYKDSTIDFLHLSNDVDFETLIIRDTNCESFDLSASIVHLDVSCNKLKQLKFKGLQSIKYFNASNNFLTEFHNNDKVNQIINKKLMEFYIQNNNIQNSLILNNNVLQFINVNDNPQLQSINVNDNRLVDFIAYNTVLNDVRIKNQSKIIQIKQNNKTIKQTIYTLLNFICDNVDYIEINNNINLKKFISRNGELANFKIYNNIHRILGKLQYVDVSNTKIKSLHLENCSNLTYLNVNNCNGIVFTFSIKELIQLHCSNISLQELQIKKSKLKILDASFNKLNILQLPSTIIDLNVSNNNLYNVQILARPKSKINLRNNLLQVVQIKDPNNIEFFNSDYIENLYLLGKNADTFLEALSVDNINKICFYNSNQTIAIRDKNIQNIEMHCTQGRDYTEVLFVQNCNIVGCTITSLNNIKNDNGFVVSINNSKLEKLIIDYSYITQINIINNYLSTIFITKPLYLINKINFVESVCDFNVEMFLRDLYSKLAHDKGGTITISSYKFNPYHQATIEIIQLLQAKNWKIKLN